ISICTNDVCFAKTARTTARRAPRMETVTLFAAHNDTRSCLQYFEAKLNAMSAAQTPWPLGIRNQAELMDQNGVLRLENFSQYVAQECCGVVQSCSPIKYGSASRSALHRVCHRDPEATRCTVGDSQHCDGNLTGARSGQAVPGGDVQGA